MTPLGCHYNPLFCFCFKSKPKTLFLLLLTLLISLETLLGYFILEVNLFHPSALAVLIAFL